ncbi:hypothetical protein [uncultured Reyranella sp.]|uniref:hypothetical protein n=1 Tax=uncultured Reyranella sp. TaxID=735512 RepID=UPI0025FE784B|nr:hypothetical protein [uncultured Reyranella sp.]
MKTLLIAAALLGLGTSSAMAAITCWYNPQGDYTGADEAQPGFPVGKVVKGTSGDYAWGYTVEGMPQSCPRKLPKQ